MALGDIEFFGFIFVFSFFSFYFVPKFLARYSGWDEAHRKYPYTDSADGVQITGLFTPAYFRFGGMFLRNFGKPHRVTLWVTDSGLHVGRPAYFFWSKAILVPWGALEFAEFRGVFQKRVRLSVSEWKDGYFEMSGETREKLSSEISRKAKNEFKNLSGPSSGEAT